MQLIPKDKELKEVSHTDTSPFRLPWINALNTLLVLNIKLILHNPAPSAVAANLSSNALFKVCLKRNLGTDSIFRSELVN